MLRFFVRNQVWVKSPLAATSVGRTRRSACFMAMATISALAAASPASSPVWLAWEFPHYSPAGVEGQRYGVDCPGHVPAAQSLVESANGRCFPEDGRPPVAMAP